MKNFYIIFIIISLVLIIVLIKKMIMKNKTDMPFFKFSDFDSPKGKSDIGKTYVRNGKEYLTDSGKTKMQSTTIDKLVKARKKLEEYNKKNGKKLVFRVNSAYRTKSYNSRLTGAVDNSSHIRGYAIDISTRGYTKADIELIISLLKDEGFNRFGIYKTFIHVDNDPDKSANKTWYASGADKSIKPSNL